MLKLYEVWLTTSAGSLTTTVVTVEATSQVDAYRRIQARYPDETIRGVLEVGADD